jgi:hypothetical protein
MRTETTIFQRYWPYLRKWGFSLEWKGKYGPIHNLEDIRQYNRMEKDRIIYIRISTSNDQCFVSFACMNPDNPEPNRWRDKTPPISWYNLETLEQALVLARDARNYYHDKD